MDADDLELEMESSAFAGPALNSLFARSLANQALKHPEWELDDHKEWLLSAGFHETFVSIHVRAIAEAIHRSRELAGSR